MTLTQRNPWRVGYVEDVRLAEKAQSGGRAIEAEDASRVIEVRIPRGSEASPWEFLHPKLS